MNDNPKEFFEDKKSHETIFLEDSFTVQKVCAHNETDFVNIIKSNFANETNAFYNFSSLADDHPNCRANQIIDDYLALNIL